MPGPLGALFPQARGVRPAAGGDRHERRSGQERGEQPGHDAGLDVVHGALQGVAVQSQPAGDPRRCRLVFHPVSPLAAMDRPACQGICGVSDLGELCPQLGGAGALGVVGDVDTFAVHVHAHLIDAGLAGRVAFDVFLLLVQEMSDTVSSTVAGLICWLPSGRAAAVRGRSCRDPLAELPGLLPCRSGVAAARCRRR